jgi:hypothetical protein
MVVVWVVVVGGVVNVDVVGGGENVVVAAAVVVVVGLTLPPVDLRPGGIENGSLDPANDTGGSVSRGVGDGVTLGDSVGTGRREIFAAVRLQHEQVRDQQQGHLANQVEVQHGLIRSHRDELLDLEAQGVPQLLLRQPGQGDLADDHALVPDTEVDLLARDPRHGPQLAERLGHGLGLTDLPGLHDARRQGHLSGPNDHRDVAGRDLGHADGRRSDVHADPGPGHYAPSTWTDRSER